MPVAVALVVKPFYTRVTLVLKGVARFGNRRPAVVSAWLTHS